MKRLPVRNARGAAARVGSIVAGFALTAVVARTLEPDDSGRFFVAFAAVAVLSTLGRYGSDNYAMKVCGRNGPHLHSELRALRQLSLGVSTLVFAATTMFVLATGWGVSRVGAPTAVLIAFAVVPQAQSVFFGAVLRSKGYVASGTFAELGSTPAVTAVAIGTASPILEMNLERCLAAYACSSLITAAWASAVYRSSRVIPAAPSSDTGARLVRESFGSLSSMMATSLLFYALTWCPVLVLALTSSIESVAYYTLASRLAMVVALASVIQISYLAPQFARLFETHDILGLSRLARRSARQSFLIALIPCAVIVLGAPWLVRLVYGEGYTRVVLPLVILAVSILLVTAFGQVNQLMLLTGLEHFALRLNIALVSSWLVAGSAVTAATGLVGTSAFYAAVSVIYAWVASHRLHANGIGTRIGLRGA